jgi:hypothetical protein
LSYVRSLQTVQKARELLVYDVPKERAEGVLHRVMAVYAVIDLREHRVAGRGESGGVDGPRTKKDGPMFSAYQCATTIQTRVLYSLVGALLTFAAEFTTKPHTLIVSLSSELPRTLQRIFPQNY